MNKFCQILIFHLSVTATLSYNDETCSDLNSCQENHNKYAKEVNQWTSNILKEIQSAITNYVPCERQNCSCYKFVVEQDLAPFRDGITKEMFSLAQAKATKYQIIEGKLYRQKDCHFPARCAGVEHYLSALAPKLPNMELAINTRDWPQVNHAWGHVKAPVFSFSKTKDYYDIMYPAWSFWEGGPAIGLYPNGIGRWDKHRLSISAAAERWPWSKKEGKGFFRGSRTSEERDTLVRLSREMPGLVDAQYTKNQAWKSNMDTLNAEPAAEVSFEDHCKYKYLFNYRGVAASFRFKHLFLCKSLIFHVGSEWQEFFYPALKPWVHFVPLTPKATQSDLSKYINFFQDNDSLAQEMAERGYQFIWEHLTVKNVKCYWRTLLKNYVKLLKYNTVKDEDLIKIT